MPPTNRELARVREWLSVTCNVADDCEVDGSWGAGLLMGDIRALVKPPSTPTDAELEQMARETLREVSAIIQAEAYLPKFYPGGEADQEPPGCEGELEGRWCQAVVDVVCDIRNRTLERVAALKSVRDRSHA